MSTLRTILVFWLLSVASIAAGSEFLSIETSEWVQAADTGPAAEAETFEREPAEDPEAGETEPIEVPETTEVVSPGPDEAIEAPTVPDPDFVGPPAPPAPESGGAESEEESEPFVVLGQALEQGKLRQFNWQLETAMAGLAVPMPVLAAHGRKPGPTLCLVAAVHGDELNGVEIVRRIMFDIDLDKLAGTVVGVPIANSFGFLRSSRYLPDRRDLNRYFPGDADGSMASRFAHALFSEVIRHCEVLVDIHTGSFYRTNLPQIRADLRITRVLNLTKQFGDIAVLHTVGPSGSLRRAATDKGIAAVTMETGGPARFQEGAVAAGVKAIEALLNHLGMIRRFRLFGEPQPVIYRSSWVRVETGGILLSEVSLGQTVEKGQRLGTVTDPIHNKREVLEAPFRGRLLGMAVNQVVMPGFAAFHLGRAADETVAIGSTAGTAESTDAEHSENGVGYSEDDEFFDPAPATADEPEPEPPPGFDDGPEAEFEDYAILPEIDWLYEIAVEDSEECVQPPLIAC